MRLKTLVLVPLLAVLACSAFEPVRLRAQQALVLGSLRFETQRGEPCNLAVSGKSTLGETRRLSVSCGGRMLFDKRTPDFLVDIQRDSLAGNRFFLRWEGGESNRLQVLELTVDAKNADTVVEVFNESSIFTPDILTSPDVLLVHRDKRFNSGGEIMPSRTDVFIWKDTKYILSKSWKWGETMRYEDRLCVLQPESTVCSATPLPQPKPL